MSSHNKVWRPSIFRFQSTQPIQPRTVSDPLIHQVQGEDRKPSTVVRNRKEPNIYVARSETETEAHRKKGDIETKRRIFLVVSDPNSGGIRSYWSKITLK